MVEVGIPVYKAKDTLPNALNSLVAQTRTHFIVCLSIDCDGENYTDIIATYRARGLKIRVIDAKENGGPGIARQRIIDTTQCDYLMFMDADDMLMPQAVKNLYDAIRYSDMDILRSSFVREETHKSDQIIPWSVDTITWMHGKIYKVAYLRNNNIRFIPEIRTDEDAYFNLIAWNSTEKRGEIQDITYLWRDNKNSITRSKNAVEYFKNTYLNYVFGQVEALKRIYQIRHGMNHALVTQTILNLYTYYMAARFYKLDLETLNKIISNLKNEIWMDSYLADGNAWIELLNNVKPGAFFEDEYVVFYQETINLWITRLLRKEKS